MNKRKKQLGEKINEGKKERRTEERYEIKEYIEKDRNKNKTKSVLHEWANPAGSFLWTQFKNSFEKECREREREREREKSRERTSWLLRGVILTHASESFFS